MSVHSSKYLENVMVYRKCLYNPSVKIACTFGHFFKNCTKNQNRFFQKLFFNFSFVIHGAFENY